MVNLSDSRPESPQLRSRAATPRSTRPATDTRRARVLVLRTNPRDSSLRRVVTALSAELAVHVLAWDRRRDLAPLAVPRVTTTYARLPARYYDLSAVLGAMLLQPWFVVRGALTRPSAVHAMDLDTGVAGWVLARLLRVPFVYQCLDPYYAALPPNWPAVLGWVTRWLEDRLISASDLFIITDLRRLPQHSSARPRTVVELVNAPMGDIDPVAPPRTPAPLVVGYVGSLVPHRNLKTLVRTVGSMADDGVSLVIGGYGPLAEQVETWCRGLRNVSYLGWVGESDLPVVQAGFDVFVQVEDPTHAAYRWVSPNKLFDSMAFGRPIIVARGTLAAETVDDIGHGVAIAYGDDDALAAAIRQLRDDPQGRAQMAAAGRAAFLERWSPSRQRERVLDAYRSMLRQRQGVVAS